VSTHQIWEKHQHLFRSIAYAITGKHEEIEDILQETYRKVLSSPVELNDPDETFHYLKKAVRNTAIDWNRKFFRRNLTVKEQVSDYDRMEELRTSGDNPLSLLLVEEQKAMEDSISKEIHRALERLPAKYQEAIKTFFSIDNLPPPNEFCRKRKIPYSTMRSRMLRGIGLIRDVLAEKNEGDFVKKECRTLLNTAEKGQQHEM